VVVIASRFNEAISRRLVAGALAVLARRGIPRARSAVVWVPGAFELSAAAANVAASLAPEAIVAVGCVIQGETPQYAAIGGAVAHGLTQVAVTTGIPVTFGVIVAESVLQARQRAGGHHGNRGAEAAEAAVDLLTWRRRLRRTASTIRRP